MIYSKEKLLLFEEESERILFRKVEKSDFDAWMQFCEEQDALKYIFSADDQFLSPKEKCEKWFEKVFFRYDNQLGGMNALIEKSSGKLIGQCGLLIQTIDEVEELEIGYSLIQDFRGKGYALEAAQKCKEHAIQHAVSDSLISVIIPENTSSISVALKNGMKLDKVTQQRGDTVTIYRILIEN
jgi:[ribosomal protein S5]-alanine N-acetyltransferase